MPTVGLLEMDVYAVWFNSPISMKTDSRSHAIYLSFCVLVGLLLIQRVMLSC